MLQTKIKQLTSPTVHDRRNFVTVGKVVAANEKNNQCEVTFIDKNGNQSNKKGVQLFNHNLNILSWFPSEGDMVYIQVNENTSFIIGPYYEDYQMQRANSSLKKNILANYAFSHEGNLL